MADNLTTQTGAPATPPAGVVIATDQKTINATSVHVQRMNLAVGADGSYVGDTSGRLVDGDASASALFTDPRYKVTPVSVTSAGLTTSVTAYTTGDQLGTQFAFPAAARAAGGSGRVIGAMLMDKAKVMGAANLFLFYESVTPAADNAAVSFSDADAAKCVGIVQLTNVFQTGNNYLVSPAQGLNQPYYCTATTLYGCLTTGTGNAVFGAATDIVVTLFLALD